MQIGLPPKSKRPSKDHWIKKAKILKHDHPGEFGMVGNYSIGVATHIRHGDYTAFLPASEVEDREAYVKAHWEVTTRRTPDGRNDVYVRWIGRDCRCEACRAEG